MGHPPTFKKSVVMSLIGHLAVFTVFGFSFGRRMPMADYAQVSFFGQVLKSYDFSGSQAGTGPVNLKPAGFHPGVLDYKDLGKSTGKSVYAKERVNFSPAEYSLKPSVLPLIGKKSGLVNNQAPVLMPAMRKESTVMFHPMLPYRFNLYFQDRQVAHIGLEFKVIPKEKINSVVVKRKISSGNLEVDLLSMHYLSHYLFIQQERFPPGKWQNVKIEFSAQQ
jgi:hypothetical protein